MSTNNLNNPQKNLDVINEMIIQIKNKFIDKQSSLFICICGPAACGKTTLSKMLLTALNRDPLTKKKISLLSTDNYMLDRDARIEKNIQGYSIETHNIDLLIEDINLLKNKKNIVTKPYNHQTGKHSAEVQVLSNDIMILEGIYSFHSKILEGTNSLKYFMNVNDADAKMMKIITDVNSRGHSIFNAYMTSNPIFNSYKTHIFPFIEAADYIIEVNYNWKLKSLIKKVDKTGFRLHSSTTN